MLVRMTGFWYKVHLVHSGKSNTLKAFTSKKTKGPEPNGREQ